MKKRCKSIISRAWQTVKGWIETLKAVGNWGNFLGG